MTPPESVVRLLRSRGADVIAHLDGDLLAHLVGTSVLLESWGCARSLVLAGLCHACYGTGAFPRALLELSERSLLEDAIGARAEALVYLYASCDRAFFHPRIGEVRAPKLRDRFTGAVYVPTRAQISSLLELTFANELEIARRSRSFLEAHRASLHDLFSRCQGLVSDRAFECFLETCGREGRACSR
jgi:hypothetical protein